MNEQRLRATCLGLLAAVFLVAPALAQPNDPWSAMAQRDLQVVHDTILANHPGPVDPQNPAYRDWLERGFVLAEAKAAQARGFAGYERALMFYVNGFRDGHISLLFRMDPTRVAWPGFLVHRIDGEPAVKVAFSVPESNVPKGAELVACDGQSPDQMLAERLDPYFWNADIPHERWRNLPQLFILDRYETAARFKTCTFRIAGSEKAIDLQWSITPRQDVMDRVTQLDPQDKAGLHKREGMWFVTIPSFDLFGKDADPIRQLIADIKTHAAEVRTGTVVFDVRGNRGGNSAWALMIAAAFWGDDLINHVVSSSDETVDWRVSPSNLAHLASSAEQARRDGQADAEQDRVAARDAMKQALDRGQQLVTVAAPATSTGPLPPNPVKGRVYLLTDTACFSSCLIFADLLKQMPNVRHIGLPTDADTAYVDNDQVDLPSGLTAFSYSMKVYRHKARKNNQWYEPDVHWPGGAMTDEALARWIKTLN